MKELFKLTPKRVKRLHRVFSWFAIFSLILQTWSGVLLTSSVFSQEETPTQEPTVVVEPTPTEFAPTENPVGEPTIEPTAEPSTEPIVEPIPTAEPTSTIEPTPTEEPVGEPIVEPTEEPLLTPTIDLDLETPAEPPESATIITTPTPEEVKEITKVCLTDEQIINTTNEDWNIDNDEGIAETKEAVKLGVTYLFPLENKVSVTFKCLPEDESLRTPLKIQQIKVSDLKFPEGVNPATDYAYDITTGMTDGTFEYDVTLPKPEGQTAEVSYIEKSADEVKNQTEPLKTDDVKVVENNLSQELDTVKAAGIDHFSIYFTQSVVGTGGVTPLSTIDNVCMDDLYSGNLNCTANDVSIANVSNIQILDADGGCTSPSDTVTFQATWDVLSTATARYDVGLYFSNDGDPNHDGALTGHCSISTLPNAPVPPYFNFDGDICGDISSARTVSPTITMTVQCLDPDGDNTLNLPYCTSWRQAGANQLCTGPLDAFPGAPSKCNCDTGFEIPIPVPDTGTIVVDKVTNPSGDPQSFSFTTTGTGYVGFSLTDASTPNSQILNVGSYSVAETPQSGWTLTNTVCVSSIGDTETVGNLELDANETITCTFTNTLQTGHIIVDKVTNPSGDSQSFDFATTGSGYSGFSLTDAAAPNDQTLNAGIYSVAETVLSGWLQTSAACLDGTAPINPSSIVLVAGHTVTCTFINTKNATLTLNKTVVNNNGGTASVGDFQAKIDGGNIPWGVAQVVSAASHTASESTLSGYLASSWGGDCAANGIVSLNPGDNKICSITNDDQPATLTVIKHVINDNNGSAVAGDFTINVSAGNATPSSFPGAEDPGTLVTLDAGGYSVDENFVSGYAKNIGADCSGTIANGQSKTCTITNDDIQPSLTLVKTVVNDNGGTKQVADFVLKIDGNPATSGEAVVLDSGWHTASEVPLFGYAASNWTGNCGADGRIYLNPGEAKVCNITNDDIAPTLTLIKTVTNDNGGQATADDFQAYIDGNPVPWSQLQTLIAGVHTASESGLLGYTPSVWGQDCASNGSITLAVGDTETCTITNDDQQLTSPLPKSLLTIMVAVLTQMTLPSL